MRKRYSISCSILSVRQRTSAAIIPTAYPLLFFLETPMPRRTARPPHRLPKLFILDTNVLMHDPTALFRFQEHDVFLPMITLVRLVRRASYGQIDGMPGAVSAVLDNIGRGWNVTTEPVRFNARSQDLLFRAVGRPGIVLITEGPTNRVRNLVAEEKRALKRVAPNTPIHVINVGNDEDQTKLMALEKEMRKLPKGISNQEVAALSNRLDALNSKALPIPKGIDPQKVRANRRALRGN